MLEFGDEDIESEYTHSSSRSYMNGSVDMHRNGHYQESQGWDAPWDPANASDFPALEESPQGASRAFWSIRRGRR